MRNMSFSDGLRSISEFIGIAKEISKIPRMVLPDYQRCSEDLYKICQKILTPNDNIVECFNQFLYFNFSSQNAQSDFNQRILDYKNSKSNNLRQFKFSCSDISTIYFRNIEKKIGNFFSNKSKLEDAKAIFEKLTNADVAMLDMLDNNVLAKLDKYIDDVEPSVSNGDLDSAEKKRLEFKQECKDILKELENFSNELSDLTITFAKLAHVPLTVDQTSSV